MENTWDSWLTSPLASATCQNTLCAESPGAFQLTNHFNSTHLIRAYPAWSTPGNLSLHPFHLYLFCQGVCCMENIGYLQVAPILTSAVLPRCPQHGEPQDHKPAHYLISRHCARVPFCREPQGTLAYTHFSFSYSVKGPSACRTSGHSGMHPFLLLLSCQGTHSVKSPGATPACTHLSFTCLPGHPLQ